MSKLVTHDEPYDEATHYPCSDFHCAFCNRITNERAYKVPNRKPYRNTCVHTNTVQGTRIVCDPGTVTVCIDCGEVCYA